MLASGLLVARRAPPRCFRWYRSVPAPSWSALVAVSRVSSPRPALLLMYPCFWSAGMACAAGTVPPVALLAKFAAGALIMRGAGCTLNDILDRKLDAQVSRTRERPVASGALPVKQAVMFLGGQLTAAFTILLTFNPYSIVLGASSLVVVGIYPLMKRVMNLPQLVLGMAFNWGALLGYSAIHGTCNWNVVIPLYAAGICWTLVYDTIYAHQDKSDDVKVGIKSTALYFGDRYTKPILSALSLSSIALLSLAGYAADLSSIYYVSLAFAGSHLARQIACVDLSSPSSCMATFLSNTHVGGIIAAGVFLDKLVN